MSDASEYVLILACPDRPGLVHAVSSFLVQHSGNIIESQQFGDQGQQRFFMRVRFAVLDPSIGLAELRDAFTGVAATFDMRWRVVDAAVPMRTLVLVSKLPHCLNDLLFRVSVGGLQLTVPAVVSNHETLEPLATSYGVPFHHVPATTATKSAAEARLLELVEEYDAELIVLARYMQVLGDATCRALEGRIINIHHSFLPGFKGARPYQQAYDRGVKIIGATAHYVTPELDEGPIIEQDVARAGHDLGPDALAAVGRDVEAQVLARAVKWHSESRVLLNGSRTVVFR